MDVSITGPKILLTLPWLGGIQITQSIVHGWLVIAIVTTICFVLTRNLSVDKPGKLQIVAEKIVELLSGLVKNSMGEKWLFYTPYIGALFAYSFFSSILSITGLRSPTSDFSVTLAMALVTFVTVQLYNFKSKGPIGFITRFSKPIWVMTPLNLLSEFATPVSMSLRHFGNISSGVVITAIIYGSLAALSSFVLGWIPSAFIQNIPIFQVGLPAIMSLYFDLFASTLQAYIFCMLTMVFVSGAAEE